MDIGQSKVWIIANTCNVNQQAFICPSLFRTTLIFHWTAESPSLTQSIQLGDFDSVPGSRGDRVTQAWPIGALASWAPVRSERFRTRSPPMMEL